MSDLGNYVIPKPNEDLSIYRHGSHVFLYARTSKISIEEYETKALVLMQLRFDGLFGFAGGLVEEGEAPEVAATRELQEELNYNVKKYGKIKKENHVCTHLFREGSFVTHFFGKELSEEAMRQVLTDSTKGKDVGNETFGVVFVPLYTMRDGYRGFPAFLRNNFIGNAKYQLTFALEKLNILTAEEVHKALNAKRIVNTNLFDV